METTTPARPSAKQRLDVVQKKLPVLDALIRETEIHIQQLQELLRDQILQREELLVSITLLEDEAKMERETDKPDTPPTVAINGETKADVNGSNSRRASLKGANVKISLPPMVSIETTASPTIDTPYSPPPTAILSPPPLQNRIFAGHTPSVAISVSPPPDSEYDTPKAAIPSKPIAAIVKEDTPEEIQLIPRVVDDPHLEGPLTAQDDGFLEVVTEKLEAVKVEKEAESREDSMSPERATEHTEQLDGIVLKPTRPVNFGAPLGFGNIRVKREE